MPETPTPPAYTKQACWATDEDPAHGIPLSLLPHLALPAEPEDDKLCGATHGAARAVAPGLAWHCTRMADHEPPHAAATGPLDSPHSPVISAIWVDA